jgi:hypothetical protein
VRQLLALDSAQLPPLVPDLEQSGFSVNAAQIVDPVLAGQLNEAAETLAKAFVTRPNAELARCVESNARSCALDFIEALAARAYRRPLSEEEQTGLSNLLDVGSSGGALVDGVELALTAILQAPAFVYVTELGTSDAKIVELTPHEVAAQLAYVVTGGPPDAQLLEAAANNALQTADQRETEARRLIRKSSTRFQFRRFVREWLGITTVSELVKDQEAFPRFNELRSLMLAETDAYVDEVLIHEGASLKSLLTAGFSVAPPVLATWYGLTRETSARRSLSGTGRVGILQQASFLSAHSHPLESGPVLRGVAVIRRLLCRTLQPPSEQLPPPAPDPGLTTRERFAVHSSTSSCAGCHSYIDPMGFSFENFDAMGGARSLENGRAIVTTGSVQIDDHEREVKDSVDLAHELAQSPEAEACYARQALRFVSGQTNEATEDGFLELLERLPDAQKHSVLEIVIAFVRSELFVRRTNP